jgi:hypothetical protein
MFNEFLYLDDLSENILYERESMASRDLGFSGISCRLKMKPMGCAETSLGKYHYTYLLLGAESFLRS